MINRDFTYTRLSKLLYYLINRGYCFLFFDEVMTSKDLPKKVIVLRHDIDRHPRKAMKIAQLESQLGVQSTFFFRQHMINRSQKRIKKLRNLNHRIGYHYEELSLCNGDYESAYEMYNNNISKISRSQENIPISMHGSPLSKWSNDDLWKKYNHKIDGVVGESNIDVDYNEFIYLTDTGRSWNGFQIRDSVSSSFTKKYRTTNDIMIALKNKSFPDKAIITIHPERWANDYFFWTRQFVLQNIKNLLKKFLSKKRETIIKPV